jgi:hypothetical protein
LVEVFVKPKRIPRNRIEQTNSVICGTEYGAGGTQRRLFMPALRVLHRLELTSRHLVAFVSTVIEVMAQGVTPVGRRNLFAGRNTMFNGWKQPDYVPSPAEIAQKCKEIQRGWSVRERLRRMRFVVTDSKRAAEQKVEMTSTRFETQLFV